MLTWFLYIDPRVVWFKLKRNLDRGHINPSQVKSPDTSWRFHSFLYYYETACLYLGVDPRITDSREENADTLCYPSETRM